MPQQDKFQYMVENKHSRHSIHPRFAGRMYDGMLMVEYDGGRAFAYYSLHTLHNDWRDNTPHWELQYNGKIHDFLSSETDKLRDVMETIAPIENWRIPTAFDLHDE